MLVRVSYTKSEGITNFDDAINRTTRNLHYEDWAEFLVAWRRDSIEIYRDHVCASSCIQFTTSFLHIYFSGYAREGMGIGTQAPFICYIPEIFQNQTLIIFFCRLDILYNVCPYHHTAKCEYIPVDFQSREGRVEHFCF